MALRKILVPFNFSIQDEKTLHFLIRSFAEDHLARITLFHVYTSLSDMDAYANPALVRLRSTVAAFASELPEKKRTFEQVRADLIENGFSENRVEYELKAQQSSIGEEIVAKVLEGGYDTIVLGYRPGWISRAFTRSVHEKVLGALRNKIITIVT
jgi:nucleotide-binding universal stress UspA family protein